MIDSKRLRFDFLPIVFVLIFAAFLRIPAFYLSHNNVDEDAYLSLAMKLDKYGLNDYAKNFNLHFIDFLDNEHFRAPVIGDRSIGDMLLRLKVNYERGMPTHRPPVFSLLLMASHRIFASHGYYASSPTEGNPYWHLQFYATIIPFLFSLLSIFFTYILGKMLFDERVGLYAALFLSLTPVELLAAHKIWAETALVFFTILTAIFYFLSVKSIRQGRIIYALLCGISAGIAFLTKFTGAFIVPAIMLHHLWLNRQKLKSAGSLFGVFFDVRIVLVILTAVAISFPWLCALHKSFGLNNMPKILTTASSATPWLASLGQRPWYMYIINTPCQFPIYFLGYAAIFVFFKKHRDDNRQFFLIAWFMLTLIFLSFFLWCKDDRYMLPAYPAIAILSSLVLGRVEKVLNNKSHLSGYVISSLLIILTAVIAFDLVIPDIVMRKDLLLFAFL